jgi:hypothetical protein
MHILSAKPIYAEVNKILGNNLPSYSESLWLDFFSNNYPYVKHEEVIIEGEENYYLTFFQNKFTLFKNQVLKEKAYYNEAQDSVAAEDTATMLQDWHAYLNSDPQFKLRTKNVLLWAFYLVSDVLIRFEDLVVTKSKQIKVPTKATELASAALSSPENKFETPVLLSADEVESQVDDGVPDQNWKISYNNSQIKIRREKIRTHRSMLQQQTSQVSSMASTLNSAVTEHSNLLKSIATLHSALMKSIIKK